MKWSATAAALVLAAAPMAAQQATGSASQPGTSPQTAQQITLRGCVTPGVDSGTYLLTHVTERPAAGRSAIPTDAHGRKVLFWLDKDEGLRAHAGKMVEVMGTTGEIEKSEIELKPGRQASGGLIAEFEGPGKDVKAPTSVLGGAVGTSGTAGAPKDDIKTFLFKVKVDDVRVAEGSCQ